MANDNVEDDMAVETEDIEDEISQLLKKCNELHSHFHESSKTIQELHKLVDNHKNIIVKYDNWTGDFDELLEKIHNCALEGIKENGTNNFGEKLLEALDCAVFIN
jgi:uncharacterized coiled-coil DUF342 family protein